MHDCDLLIVGSGLAGLAAALSVHGRRVTLLTPWMPPGGTASSMAQGGIAAAVGADDSPALHAADTLRAGAGACRETAVRVLCDEAPAAIEWLEAQGAVFDRDGTHRCLHREGAHSRPRVLHIQQDRSGFGIMRAMTRAVRAHTGIEILSGHTAVSLLTGPRGVDGVLALDRHSRPVRFRAAQTVLATGGIGQLYARTTNPRTACGDGLALALAAGARCESLELVQFHPTALAVASDPLPLLTEALRGAGARLIDAQGREFMRAAHPAAELAPRDVVAREVWRRTSQTNGDRVYLDARELMARSPQAFPSVRSLCAAHHLDPQRDLLPVTAAAHYHMGGVAVDLDGRTSLERLWACGEVACTGAHGANRLASNSLLEAVVFGRRLGRALSDSPALPAREPEPLPQTDGTLEVDAAMWQQVRELMWRDAGIVRDATGLERARAQLARIHADVPPAQIQLLGRIRVAQAIVSAALARTRSVGAHYRADESVTACARVAG